MVAQWVAHSPHSKKVAGSSLGWVSWCFCVEFACSPRVGVGFLRVLRFPPRAKETARASAGCGQGCIDSAGVKARIYTPLRGWELGLVCSSKSREDLGGGDSCM